MGERDSLPVLTTDEVAERFRVDPRTVRRWARSGKIPAIKTPGGVFRFDLAEIEKQLASGTPAA